MHTLEELRAEYDRLDALIGIDTRGIELKISTRAVRQLGSFRAPAPGRRGYAHAAVWLLYPGQRHGHDRVWKDMCRRVGCQPKSRAPSTGLAAQKREEKVRYIIRCERCGAESRYVRRGKAVELLLRGRGRALRCRRCGGNRFTLLVRE